MLFGTIEMNIVTHFNEVTEPKLELREQIRHSWNEIKICLSRYYLISEYIVVRFHNLILSPHKQPRTWSLYIISGIILNTLFRGLNNIYIGTYNIKLRQKCYQQKLLHGDFAIS